MSLIPGMNLNLEKTAHDMFGAAVNDFGTRAINNIGGDILRSVVGDAEADTQARPFSGAWQTTKYAADLIKYAPKHRFMFKVQFIFDPSYVKLMEGKDPNAFSYLVKMVDRPKVEFSYEDVNYYNFRTKVLKEIRHEPLAMTFIDDIGNNTSDFFNEYRKAFSPISRTNTFDQSLAMQNGMNFTHPLLEHQSDSAARGVLGNGATNVLKQIIVRQIFAHGSRMCEYYFHNPRILRFDFDEVSHESSEGNGLSVQFDYDALYVSEAIQPNGTPAPRWGISDINGNVEGTGSQISTADKVKGTIADSLINAGTRIAGSAASNLVRNATKNIPFVGDIVSGYAGNMANRVVTGIGRDTLRTAAYNVQNSIAKPETPVVTENGVDAQP